MKRKLRRLWKKLRVGLAASAKERDITHGKINKFGGTGIKAAAIVAVPLLMVASAEAQSAFTLNSDNGQHGSLSAAREFGRAYRDYLFSTDGVHTVLSAINGTDPYGANAIARSMDAAGGQSGISLNAAGPYPSQIAIGPLSGTNGSYRWGTTLCDY